MGRFRNERVTLRLADYEKELLYDKMKKVGFRNITDFIITAICKHSTIVVDTSPILEIKGELSRIGNNINQIAKVANSTHNVNSEEIENLRDELTAVRNMVEKAFQMSVEGRKIQVPTIEKEA